MFVVNEDLSIYATRGDIVFFSVSAEDNGEPYTFRAGDVVRMTIYGKKDAENVVLQKDFPVTANAEKVEIYLAEEDTKIGGVISKPTDYWYEIELNPFTNPQTIIGYDEEGAKIFKLFPEGNEVEGEDEPVTPEDIPVVDTDLSLLSDRPVENRAIARAVALVLNDMELMDKRLTGKIKENKKNHEALAEQVATNDAVMEQEIAVERARIDNLVSGATADDAEVVDIRVGANGATYGSAGTAVRSQLNEKMNLVDGVAPKSATKNLLLLEHYKTGHYYDSNNGVLVEANGGYYPTVSVKPNTVYTNCRCQILCIYDENMNFIGSDTEYSALKTFTTPENAAYITVSGSITNYGTEGLYLGEYTGEYVVGEKLFAVSQIDGLQAELNRTVKKKAGKNLFNKDSETLIFGSYINAITGEHGPHSAYCYDILDAEPNATYTVSTNQNVHIAFFDEMETYISGHTSSGGVTFTAPHNAHTMSVSVRQEYLDTFQIENGAEQTVYSEYQEGIDGGEILDQSVSMVKLSEDVQSALGGLTVHVGDGHEYKSILAALKAYNGHAVTVYVHTGVYDLVAEYENEYGSDYFDNYTGYSGSENVFDRGLNLCDGASIVGIGNVEITFLYGGDNENVKKYFAPINTTQNNTVENISLVIGDGCCRYGIHDDFADGEGTNVFQNCYFSGASHLNTFMGCGFGMENTYLIESCVFDNAGGLNIAYHNNEKAGAKNKLIIKDCYCNGGIRGGMYGASTEVSIMQVTNCKASGISCVLIDDTGTYANENIKLIAWNNEV